MIRMPSRKLPPSAEPWGRAVDNELATISRTNEKQAQDTNNALSAVNGTLTRLGEQVSEIRTITETLVEQQATLEAQQEQLQTQQTTLSNQQTQLAQTVSELQTVVNGMIRPTAQQVQNSGFTLTPSTTAVSAVSFPVPQGYTRAVVTALSTVSVYNNAAGGDLLYNQINIRSLPSGEAFGGLDTMSWRQVSVHSTRVIAVTPGTDLVIDSSVRSGVGTYSNTGNQCRLVAQVLFLR